MKNGHASDTTAATVLKNLPPSKRFRPARQPDQDDCKKDNASGDWMFCNLCNKQGTVCGWRRSRTAVGWRCRQSNRCVRLKQKHTPKNITQNHRVSSCVYLKQAVRNYTCNCGIRQQANEPTLCALFGSVRIVSTNKNNTANI